MFSRYALATVLMLVGIAASQANQTKPLFLYYSPATAEGVRNAQAAGYRYVRKQACVFVNQVQGTVPLKLYWSAARGDNFTTATARGESDALAAGYRFVRVEGYVFPVDAPDSTHLVLYWGRERGDNFTATTERGARDARAARYARIRVEGYGFYPETCR
jgi:hypothetical protein